MNVYKNMGFGFELQPSHYLAWVRGLVGDLHLGSFRDVPTPELMSRPTKLNFPVKLEKRTAPPVANRTEAKECGSNLAVFLSMAFNEELGNAMWILNECCARLVLNDPSFKWEHHVQVLEDALRQIDDNVVLSEVAAAQCAWDDGITLSSTNSAVTIQQLREVVQSAASRGVAILVRPEQGLDPNDEDGVLSKRYMRNQFMLSASVNEMGMSNMEKRAAAAKPGLEPVTKESAPVEEGERPSQGSWQGPPEARAKGPQEEPRSTSYTWGRRMAHRKARRSRKRRGKARSSDRAAASTSEATLTATTSGLDAAVSSVGAAAATSRGGEDAAVAERTGGGSSAGTGGAPTAPATLGGGSSAGTVPAFSGGGSSAVSPGLRHGV